MDKLFPFFKIRGTQEVQETEYSKFSSLIAVDSSAERLPMRYFRRVTTIQQKKLVLSAKKKNYRFQQLSMSDKAPWNSEDWMSVRYVLAKVLKSQKSLKGLNLPKGGDFLKGQSHLCGLKKLEFPPLMRLHKLKENIQQEKKNLRRIKNLKIHLQKYPDDDIDRIDHMRGVFQAHFETLTLRLICSEITTEDMTRLGSQMRSRLQKLQRLKLTLKQMFPPETEEEKIKVLCSKLGDKLKCLKSLDLELPTNNEGLRTLSEWIGNNQRNLRDLRLDLYHCQSLTDDGIKTLCSNLSNNLKELKSFTISLFENPSLTHESIKVMGEHVGKNMQTLEELNIQFNIPEEIPGETIDSFGKSVSENLKVLKKLNIGFHSRCENPENNRIRSLCTFIGKNLQQLESLTLLFSLCKISDEVFQCVGREIGDNLHNLKHINLSFYGCQEITDSGISKFFANLIGSKERPWQSLWFDFCHCQKLSDSCLKALSLHIGDNLPVLQSFRIDLDINFAKPSRKMKEEARALRTELLNKMKHLRYLHIKVPLLLIKVD